MEQKQKSVDTLGFKAAIGISALVGLTGGFLFGVWDSVTVLIKYAPSPVAFGEIFLLALYSVALYGIIGCLGMAIMGVVSYSLIRTGRYNVNKSQLAAVFIGVFVLLTVFILFISNITLDNIIGTAEGTVIGVISGVGLAGVSVYILGKGIRKERLIAGSISSIISLSVLLYGGLWVNLSLLFRQAFFRPISLVSDVVVLLLVGLLAVGIYILFLSVLLKWAPRRTRLTGYILLAIIVCAFGTISFIGPFSYEQTTEDAASAAHEIEIPTNSGYLKEMPNILWIVMDTVRADHLSCYGYYRNTTPNIDRITSEGTLFENAISAAPWTLPSHASMFTGMFPSQHGTDAEHQWLEDGFQTIAEVLQSHGYKTFGYSNTAYISQRINLSQGFDTYTMDRK